MEQVTNEATERKHPNKTLGVLVLSQTYPPDVGGVETHLEDLTEAFKLQHPELRVWMVAYKPIVTEVKSYLPREQHGNLSIRRFWWIGGNLFRKLEKAPALMVLYIVPYFMVRLFFYMALNMRKVDVIHVHGINMAMVGLLFGKLFRKRLVFQSHALYSFVPGSAFAKVTAFLLKRMDAVLTLCNASKNEFIKLGVPAEQITVYRYWIDLERFNVLDRASHQGTQPHDSTIPSFQYSNGGIPLSFTAFFIGRLIGIKGEDVVIELARRFPEVYFKIAGGGPNQQRVMDAARSQANLEYVGLVPNQQVQTYYQTADVVLVPSQYPEGFGRVICEALACGTPVIASNIGGIPDAMDDTVGVLCDLDVNAFAKALDHMVSDREGYQSLRRNCRPYAERQFGTENADVIFKAYQ